MQDAVVVAGKTRAEVRGRVLSLAWPVMAEHALGTLTHMVDMIMIGRLGAVAVAGIGLSFQPFFFVAALFMGISVGTTAIVARCVGAGDREGAGYVTAQSILMAVGLGVVVAAAGFVFAEPVILLMGGEPEVVSTGAVYIRNLVPGIVFMLISAMLGGALRGAGDTRTPMKVNVGINLLNVFGNWVLIFGHLGFPALGVQGAAIATSLARSTGGLILLYLVLKGRAGLKFSLAALVRVHPPTWSRILRVGVPAAMERVVMSGAQVLYVRIVASLGTVAFAAHAIALNAESVSYMPGMGFAVAATALVGQSLGAGDPEAARRSGWESGRLAMMGMGGVGLLLFTFPHVLMRLYTPDAEVIRLGVICLRIMGLAQAFQAAGFVFSGALRGAGDTLYVMYITVAGTWLVRLGLAYLLVVVFKMGLAGAWVAMALDWVVRSSGLIYRFQQGQWQKIKV
ncbi:MAG: MATE family efflux transporter [Bacillota bacterium]